MVCPLVGSGQARGIFRLVLTKMRQDSAHALISHSNCSPKVTNARPDSHRIVVDNQPKSSCTGFAGSGYPNVGSKAPVVRSF